jgi:hypothetical protein
VVLRAPWRPGQGRMSSIRCTAVRVGEGEATEAEDRWEWLLLGDADIPHFAQARECALQYAARWLLAEYHKAIQTG